tara:strand:+ start:5264 stop:5509 length:246 start_codon:yes stop_codon:yes gene_type:complete
VEKRVKKGAYIRWVVGHRVFQASATGLLGSDPIYRYGIVMEVSQVDPNAIVVHSDIESRDHHLIILDIIDDNVEILSKGGK